MGSTREVYNIFQADSTGCHIITVPNNILSKLKYLKKNLNSFSIDTVKMFYKDAKEAGFSI